VQAQRLREAKSTDVAAAALAKAKKTQQERAKARKEKKGVKEDEDDLPEVDQATNKSLRQRVK